MWAYQMAGPYRLDQTEIAELTVADLQPGEVLLDFEAGAVCGSDLPQYRGVPASAVHTAGAVGSPMHEIVGRVVATRSETHVIDDQVVGWVTRSDGLKERFVTTGDRVERVNLDVSPAKASLAQSVACVLSCFDRTGPVAGRDVAVMGLGAFGLMISYIAKVNGARAVVGVDLHNREPHAAAFGVDHQHRMHVSAWADSLSPGERPEVVFEAIGHAPHLLNDAVQAVAPGGTISVFGVPDDSHYAFEFSAFFRKNAHLVAGVTTNHRHYLQQAQEFLAEHPLLFDLITHTFSVDQAELAFNTAAGDPQLRLKVVIADESASRE